jgi:serine/threonine protein kinase
VSSQRVWKLPRNGPLLSKSSSHTIHATEYVSLSPFKTDSNEQVSVTTVREIKILKALNHPNIVEIIDMVVERSMSYRSEMIRTDTVENPADRSRGDVFMVFPYMDHDLCGLLANSDFKLNHSVAKLLMKQILQGMDYIHAVCPLSLCRRFLVLSRSARPLCSELMAEQLHSSRYQDCQYPCGSSRGD